MTDHHDVTVNYAVLRHEDADNWRNWTKSKRYWWGVVMGVLLMCLFDLTDLHICVGNCDAKGGDIADLYR